MNCLAGSTPTADLSPVTLYSRISAPFCSVCVGFDPCATANIILQPADIRANRVANCTALAAQQGRTFDFNGSRGALFYPNVFTASLTYTPNDVWSVNWTADWQSANNIARNRDQVIENRESQYYDTGDFTRHDFTLRYNVNDTLSMRAGVVNAFDAEQSPVLGQTLYSNFDPYRRRFFIGLHYRPF